MCITGEGESSIKRTKEKRLGGGRDMKGEREGGRRGGEGEWEKYVDH